MHVWVCYNTEPFAMMGGWMNPELERFELMLRAEFFTPDLDHPEAFVWLRDELWNMMQEPALPPIRSMAVGDAIAFCEGETITQAWRVQNLGWCEIQPEYLRGRVSRHAAMVTFTKEQLLRK